MQLKLFIVVFYSILKGHRLVLDILQANMLCRLFSFLMHTVMFLTQGYFDSLRMEVKCDNIEVQLVCPGPVVSNISSNAFSSQLDKVFTLLLYI